MSTFDIEKTVWTDADFEVMGWHDCHIHSIGFQPGAWTLLIDLDYIFKWVEPQSPDEYFKFWIAPATVVFENAHAVRIDIESTSGEIEIAGLTRGEPRETPNGEVKERRYSIGCQEGVLELWATGFKMIVRRAPCLRSAQSLDHDERGSNCFDRVPYRT